ncbi:ABC transporter permease subunit [Utexia brackfieldae]|uniref:ABC transporter permease subunit n=1 Tax=Utexia brackfieldae TaxID=3074108 RepID=UPI00370DA888
MIIYILKKILTFLFILLVLSQLSFCIVYFSADVYYSHLPLFEAYNNYFKHLFSGELQLNDTNQSLVMIIKQVLPATIELCLFALVITMVTGITFGIIAGLNPDNWKNRLIQAACLVISACPLVWLAVLIMFSFSDNIYLLPTKGSTLDYQHAITGFPIIDILLVADHNKGYEVLKELQYLALPSVILAIHPCIITIQLVSQSIEKIAKQNYIKALSIRVQSQWKILFRHMLPNVFPPIIPRLTYNFNVLLFSAMLIEIIFHRPGLGSWVMQAFEQHHDRTIAVALLLCGLLLSTLNLISELIMIVIHPLRHKELYDE